jgi:thiamine biosynthesis protein ThiI
MGVVLKRMMLRAASKIAERMEIQALVTGESVAQVSSQTLQNLAVIDAVTDMLVLRPLITMDKTDIIELSRKIGTEPFAAVMPEYCGVISVKPTTRARLERIMEEEQNFNFSVLDTAIQAAQFAKITDMGSSRRDESPVEIVNTIQHGEYVIDIRHPEEEQKSPLVIDNIEIKKIPFYGLHTQAKDLDTDKVWLLYCERGVMSRLHAQHLKDEGYTNIKVFRP